MRKSMGGDKEDSKERYNGQNVVGAYRRLERAAMQTIRQLKSDNDTILIEGDPAEELDKLHVSRSYERALAAMYEAASRGKRRAIANVAQAQEPTTANVGAPGGPGRESRKR